MIRPSISPPSSSPVKRFSYTFARSLDSVANVVNNDSRVNDLMKVCFIPNFRVSNAQLIYPVEILQQIFTGKEASGANIGEKTVAITLRHYGWRQY